MSKEKQEKIISAATKEFSKYPFKSASINRIIKKCGISRGSFYQYFEDKFDLYKLVFEQMAQVKISYFGDDLDNTSNLPLLDLIDILLSKGLDFASDNPDYAKIAGFLLMNKDEIFDRIMADNLELSLSYYRNYIENDKAQGRIREDVDTNSLARLIVSLSLQSTTDHFLTFGSSFDKEHAFTDLKSMLHMLKKGIV